MRYKLVYTKRAVKDIKKLDPVAQKKLEKALETLKKDPLSYSRKLLLKKLGGYRFRVGDHRVIFDLDKSRIVILRVGHRWEIYQPRASN